MIRATTRTTVGVLAQRLSEYAGDNGGGELYSERAGPLPASRTLEDAMIRDGDVLRASPPPRPWQTQASSGWELCIVGGPGAGRRIDLPPGSVTIGRAPDAGFCIDDPSLSRP